MNKQEMLLDRVRKVFKLAMDNQGPLDIDTERDMIEEWDSINHLNLIVELESEFNTNFSMNEIEHMNSVRLVIETLSKKISS